MSQAPTFIDLPDEILLKILYLCKGGEAYNLLMVSKAFQKHVSTIPRIVFNFGLVLGISARRQCTVLRLLEDASAIGLGPALDWNQADLAGALMRLRALEHLSCHDDGYVGLPALRSADLQQVFQKHGKSLRVFRWAGWLPSAPLLMPALTTAPNLIALDIRTVEIADDDLAALARAYGSALQSLGVRVRPRKVAAMAPALSAFGPQLKALYLTLFREDASVPLALTARLASLTALSLSYIDNYGSVATLRAACALTNLVHLSLTRVDGQRGVAVPSGLRRLMLTDVQPLPTLDAALPELRELHLVEVSLADNAALRALASAHHLHTLHIVRCSDWSPAAVLCNENAPLPSLRQLRWVSVRCELSWEWNGWQRLHVFELDGTFSQPHALELLLGMMTELRHLVLALPDRYTVMAPDTFDKAVIDPATEVFTALSAGAHRQLRRFDYIPLQEPDLSVLEAALDHCPKLMAIALPTGIRDKLGTLPSLLDRTGVGLMWRNAV